jgi:hypothetical protein
MLFHTDLFQAFLNVDYSGYKRPVARSENVVHFQFRQTTKSGRTAVTKHVATLWVKGSKSK